MEKQELAPESKNIKTLFKFDTEYSADSVEWCPQEPYQDFFVCGNYQLTEEQDNQLENRVGCILLFSIDSDSGLRLHQKINTAAVLDQKWCPNKINDISILGVVNAKRKLEIYEFKNKTLKFLVSYTFIDDETETLILSLDWSTGKYPSEDPYIVCSDSKGNIHLLKFSNNQLILEKTWHGHHFQAWITGFYYWDTNIFFSGGDDALFLKFDKRCGDNPVTKNRQHETGVTSFHCNKSQEFIVVTGSYDEQIRLWDIRNIRNPIHTLKMPGTLWRLKWDPHTQKFLLAACMLGGVHIVDASESDKIKIVESYYEHKDISYGADWCFLPDDEVKKFDYNGNVLLGTCSFYDHLLSVSKTSCNFNGEYIE